MISGKAGQKLRPVPDIEPIHEGRRIARLGIALIALFFGGGGLWLVLAPLSGAATNSVQVNSATDTAAATMSITIFPTSRHHAARH